MTRVHIIKANLPLHTCSKQLSLRQQKSFDYEENVISQPKLAIYDEAKFNNLASKTMVGHEPFVPYTSRMMLPTISPFYFVREKNSHNKILLYQNKQHS